MIPHSAVLMAQEQLWCQLMTQLPPLCVYKVSLTFNFPQMKDPIGLSNHHFAISQTLLPGYCQAYID